MNYVFFAVQATFLQPTPTNPTKVAEEVYLSVLQHPTKYQAKILTEKFYY